jgi:hypothetical protein
MKINKLLNNTFLKKQLELGNIKPVSNLEITPKKYTQQVNSIWVETSSLIKNSTYIDKKQFKDKITRHLKKIGFVYNPIADTYDIIKRK